MIREDAVEAVARRRRLVAREGSSESRARLASALVQLGVCSSEKPIEATMHLREAVGLLRAALPSNIDEFRPLLANAELQLGYVLAAAEAANMSSGSRAEEAYRNSVAHYQLLAAADPERHLGRLSEVLAALNRTLAATGTCAEERLRLLCQLVEVHRRLDVRGPQPTDTVVSFASALRQRSDLLAAEGRHAEARTDATEAIDVANGNPPVDQVMRGLCFITLAKRLLEAGAVEEASAHLETAVALLDTQGSEVEYAGALCLLAEVKGAGGVDLLTLAIQRLTSGASTDEGDRILAAAYEHRARLRMAVDPDAAT